MQVVTYETPDSTAAAADLNPVLTVVAVATKSIVNQLHCCRRGEERVQTNGWTGNMSRVNCIKR